MSCICVLLPAFWQDSLAEQTTAVTDFRLAERAREKGGIARCQLSTGPYNFHNRYCRQPRS